MNALRWALMCGAMGLLLAGCRSHAPQQVVPRLPSPATLSPELIAPPPGSAPAPAVTASTPPPHRPAIPANWIPPGGVANRWTSIVIHHTASDAGSLTDIDQWHRGQGWDACGYHFVIGNGSRTGDGQIEVGPRWRDQSTGAHTRLFGRPSSPEGNYYNEHGIGIVLVGNFDKKPPTARQMDALVRLISYLTQTCGINTARVYVHGDLKATDCPGQFFSKPYLRRRLLDALAARNDINSYSKGS